MTCDFPYRCGDLDYELLYPIYFTVPHLVIWHFCTSFVGSSERLVLVFLLQSFSLTVLVLCGAKAYKSSDKISHSTVPDIMQSLPLEY